jgi:type II secretory pathway pseudopilin PulG
MLVVAILAVLAVVAVPSFVRYMRRAKTSEAVTHIDQMFRGAVVYFSTPRVDPTDSQRLADCVFPDPAPPTPAASCCDPAVDADRDGRCDATTAAAWDTPSWQALSFAMRDHHYFVYSADSAGANDDAMFTATANGDLDCDGEMSTFRRRGLGSVAQRGECAVRSGVSFVVEKETE